MLTVIQAINSFGTTVSSYLINQNLPAKFYEAGKNATLGFANGIGDSEAAKKVLKEAQKIADKALATMTEQQMFIRQQRL